jgi:hypothetical protein
MDNTPHSVEFNEESAEYERSCKSLPFKIIRYDLPTIKHTESNTKLDDEGRKLGNFFIFCIVSGLIMIALRHYNIVNWGWDIVTFPLWGPIICCLGLISILFLVLMIFVVVLILMAPLFWLYSKFGPNKESL